MIKNTDIKSYEKAVKIAENSVKNMKDVELRKTAFKVILENLIKGGEYIKKDYEMEVVVPPEPSISTESKKLKRLDIRNRLKKILSDFLKISSDDIGLVYEILEDGSFEITCNFGNETGKSSQVQYVLLYLLANFIINKKRKCKSLEIIRKMKNFGFGGLPNINAYLRSLKPILVRVQTKKKKSENTFEITDFGIKITKNIVFEIIKNKGIVKSRPESLPEQIKNIKSESELTKYILDLIDEGFLDDPKPISEIKKKLEEKGHFYERNIIDEKIRRRFLGKELRRLKRNKIWYYVVKK